MKQRRFTIVELLIVISVIAILLAILLPVLNNARRRAKNAGCQSNLKQVASAILTYTTDADDFFPPSANGVYGEDNNPYRAYIFAGNIVSYLGIRDPRHPQTGKVDYYWGVLVIPVLRCPASTYFDRCSVVGYNTYLAGGSLTVAGKNPNPCKVYKVSMIKYSSEKILNADSEANGTFYLGSTSRLTVSNETRADFFSRHNNRLNYSFVDGHVRNHPWNGFASQGGLQCHVQETGDADYSFNFGRHWLPNY